MAADGKTPAESAGNLDADVKRLQLDAEKAKYLEAIARSQQNAAGAQAASLKSVLPKVTDAPGTGVTLGDTGGAFGPWRAHQIIDAVAQQIAAEVRGKLNVLNVKEPRVLVVGDRSLIEGDWMAHYVRHTLDRLSRRMDVLHDRVRHGARGLDWNIGFDIRRFTEYMARLPTTAARQEAPQAAGEPHSAPEGTLRSETAPAPASTGTVPVGVPAALGAAGDLLGLIGTDYTVTASTVTTGPAELVTLTAAHLVEAGLPVEADVFSTMRASPSMEKLDALLKARDGAVDELLEVAKGLIGIEAQLAAVSVSVATLEQVWANADAESEFARTALEHAAELAGSVSRGEETAGYARALVTHAQQIVTEVDAAVAALLQAPEGGQAPLFTAVRHERLKAREGVQDVITHVLYVNLDAVAADTVTRRSVFGASGVLRFLAAGNASWLLLDTSNGAIVGGNQKSSADVMTFSLETGEAAYDDVPKLQRAQSALKDPLGALEGPARVLVVLLAAVLAVLGVLSAVAVIRVIVR